MALGLLEPLLLDQLVLALDSPVAPDVKHVPASLPQHPADQPPPVAVGGVLLAAHQRRPAGLDAVEEPLHALLKLPRLGQTIIEHVPFAVVELVALRPPSQHRAEEQILHSPALELAADRLPVELRGVPGVGTGTHVHDQPDPVPLDQREKSFQRVIRMPDREDRDVLLGPLVFHRSGVLGKGKVAGRTPDTAQRRSRSRRKPQRAGAPSAALAGKRQFRN